MKLSREDKERLFMLLLGGDRNFIGNKDVSDMPIPYEEITKAMRQSELVPHNGGGILTKLRVLLELSRTHKTDSKKGYRFERAVYRNPLNPTIFSDSLQPRAYYLKRVDLS